MAKLHVVLLISCYVPHLCAANDSFACIAIDWCPPAQTKPHRPWLSFLYRGKATEPNVPIHIVVRRCRCSGEDLMCMRAWAPSAWLTALLQRSKLVYLYLTAVWTLLCRPQTRNGWIGAYKYLRRGEQCTSAFWAVLKSRYDAGLGTHVGTFVATLSAVTPLCSSCRHGLNSFKLASGSLSSEQRQLSHARSSPVTQPLCGLISGDQSQHWVANFTVEKDCPLIQANSKQLVA